MSKIRVPSIKIVTGLLYKWYSELRTNSSISVSSDQRLVSHSPRVLWVVFTANFHWWEASSDHSTIKLRPGKLQRQLSTSKFQLSTHRICGAQPGWPSDSWSTLRPKKPSVVSPRSLALQKSPLNSKPPPFKQYWGHSAVGSLQCNRNVFESLRGEKKDQRQEFLV